METVEDIQGRMETVHKHFCIIFPDTTKAVIPEWIDRRWPKKKTLEALPVIDGERVREITWAFRKRTSCAEDHVVIEILRELDADIWETIACCFRHRLMNHWTECDDQLSKTQLVTMVK